MAKSARIAELSLDTARIPEQPSIIVPGTILCRGNNLAICYKYQNQYPGVYLMADDDFKPDLNALRLKNRPVIPDFLGSSESTCSAEEMDLQDVFVTQDGKDITPPG
jgi:hypothetical protein